MPHEPKRRHSTQRKGKRRASIHLSVNVGAACANCGNIKALHTVCKQCGYYDGRQVIEVKSKARVIKKKSDENSA